MKITSGVNYHDKIDTNQLSAKEQNPARFLPNLAKTKKVSLERSKRLLSLLLAHALRDYSVSQAREATNDCKLVF